MKHKAKPALGPTIRSIESGKRPRVSAEQLELLHKHFPKVKTSVDKKGGSWGDVARGLSEKSGIDVNGQHAIWLHYNRKKA